MIGLGSPNRPNHLGRNVLMCQSSIVVRGFPHSVFICGILPVWRAGVGVNKLNSENDIKSPAVVTISYGERYAEKFTYARSESKQ